MEKVKNYFGIIGHLDVVPVGDGWTFEPFNPVISDGKLYGRGTTDDKGPVIGALYAMKAVMDTCNRLIKIAILSYHCATYPKAGIKKTY